MEHVRIYWITSHFGRNGGGEMKIHKSEGFIMGVGAKMFVLAGPVIVYGTLSSAVYGILYCIFRGVF